MLNNKISVTLPSEFVNDLKYLNGAFTSAFGGSTVTSGYGSWIDAGGKVINEDVTIVTSYTDDVTLINSLVDILTIIFTVRKSAEQDSVAVEVNNRMYFIDSDDVGALTNIYKKAI